MHRSKIGLRLTDFPLNYWLGLVVWESRSAIVATLPANIGFSQKMRKPALENLFAAHEGRRSRVGDLCIRCAVGGRARRTRLVRSQPQHRTCRPGFLNLRLASGVTGGPHHLLYPSHHTFVRTLDPGVFGGSALRPQMIPTAHRCSATPPTRHTGYLDLQQQAGVREGTPSLHSLVLCLRASTQS